MLQKYIKIFIFISISILITPAALYAMQEHKIDPQGQQVEEWERHFREATPQPMKTFGYGPYGMIEQPQRTQQAPRWKLSKRILYGEKDLRAEGWCQHCILRYFSQRNSEQPKHENCQKSLTCIITNIIDQLLNDIHPRLGMDYWYVQYTTWELGACILTHPELLDGKPSSVDEVKTKLESMRTHATEAAIQRFASLALAHHQWFCAGHKGHFQFTYQQPFDCAKLYDNHPASVYACFQH